MVVWWDFVVVLVLVFLPWPWGVASNIQDLREQLRCHSHTQGTNSFLWQVQRHPPAYFLGTIHVPYTRVWDYIPQNTKVAFQESENIFVELDLTDPNTMSELANCQLLPNGENLSDVLPQRMYRRLKTHLQYVKRMMPQWLNADQRGRAFYADYLFEAIVGNWERKRPIWVMLVIDSLTEADIKSREIPVLDLYLAQEAARLNKRTGAVEQVEEQCIPLNGLNFTQEIFALNQTLSHQERIRAGTIRQTATLEDLIWHYNCGDLNLATFSQDTAQVPSMQNTTPEEIELANQIDRYFRHELIFKRNRRMAMRVKAILEAKPKQSFFFALGTGHFLGNHTVFDFLEKAGVEVVNVPTDTPLNSSKSSQSSVDGDGEEETSEGSSRRHRKRDRRRKKKKQRLGETEIGHVISVPVPVRAENNNRQFNELWIPLDRNRISEIPSSKDPPREGDANTAKPTQVYAAHNLPSVSAAGSGGSRHVLHQTLYLALSLHIVLYILSRIDR